MTRNEKRAFVIGFVLACSLFVGLIGIHDGQVSHAMAQQDRTSDSLTSVLLASARRARASQARQQHADSTAEAQSRRAEAIANRFGTIASAIKALRPDTTTPVGGDTLAYTIVQREGDPTLYRIPQFVIADRARLLDVALTLKQSWEASESARLQYANETVPDLTRQLVDAGNVIKSLRTAIEIRDAQRKPRCGTRCGVALGVASTLAAAYVANHVARAAP